MVQWNDMESTFDRILATRPNTFVVFRPGGPVDMGLSPMPNSITGLSYSTSHVLPGKASTVATGSGSITFNGRFCSSPFEGGAGSVEFVRMRTDFGLAVSENLLSISGFLSLTRVSNPLPSPAARYQLTVMGEVLIDTPTTVAPSVEHVAVSVSGNQVSLILDGIAYSELIPEELEFTGANSISVSPGSGRLWGVVVRPHSITDEQCEDISATLRGFPMPEEAEADFNPTTFVLDRDLLEYSYKFRLDDLTYPDAPEASQMYNGSGLNGVEFDRIEGFFNIPDASALSYVTIDRRSATPVIVGSNGTAEDEGDFSLSPTGGMDFVDVQDLNQSSIGSPEKVNILRPADFETYDVPISSTIRFHSSPLMINSVTAPDRSIHIPPPASFVGEERNSLFGGGTVGRFTVQPDPSATTAAEYPVAYGMWVYAAQASGATMVLSESMMLGITQPTYITNLTGISKVYVDGMEHSSGPIGGGWHYISFIPTSPNNEAIEVGHNTSGNIVYTFSCFYQPNPESYLADVYRNYVSPVTVKPTVADSISITEEGGKVYSHDWSISSAD